MSTMTALLDPTVTTALSNGVLAALLIGASHAVTSRSDTSLVQVSDRRSGGMTDTASSTSNPGRNR